MNNYKNVYDLYSLNMLQIHNKPLSYLIHIVLQNHKTNS